MRPIASCANSTAETFFAARAVDSSTAVLKLHSDLAKACSRFWFLSDDAQFARTLQDRRDIAKTVAASAARCDRKPSLSDLFDGNCGRCGNNAPAYAAPMRMPTASTMAPPSTIWNTACRNRVSIYRARMYARAHNSKNTTMPAIAVAIQNALAHESGTR